jgi:hypothetical protein
MSVFTTRAALALLLAIASSPGCGSDEGGSDDVGPDADVGPELDAGPGVDLTEPVFEPDHVLEISITMEPADWDDLRTQTRSILDVLGSSCLEEPPPRPFTYFSATVTVDGETIENVGVRKKGFFGSLSTTKPSLKVKFSEYLEDQRYSGLKRLTLNNAVSDASYVKQCLGYQLFASAGVPSPRCNFATVEVNGEDLGLYVNVESIKKQFLRRHFDDDEGNMYEGALSDFRPGWVDTFQKKTNKEDPDRSDIEALVPALDVPDAQLLDELGQHIDIDAFLTFWAMELLLSHPDGYARNTNNFYMYNDPTTGLWSFIPWGIDSILFDAELLPWEDEAAPRSVWAEGVLSRRLYLLPETRTQYFDRLQEVLDTVWNEDDLLAEIDRMEALIRPHLDAGETQPFEDTLGLVRDFVSTRRSVLQSEISGTEPAWNGPLREPWCIDEIGTANATFDTTWGTLGAADPFASGVATMDVAVQGWTFTPVALGATAGLDEDSGNPAVQVVAWLADDTALIVHTVIDRNLFEAGVSLPVDWIDVTGYVVHFEFPPGGGEPTMQVVGILGEGTLEIEAAGTTDGAGVKGTLSAVVYESIF